MKFIFTILFCLSAINTEAEIIRSKVFSVEEVFGTETKIIKFSNGRVGFLEKSVASAQIKMVKDSLLEVNLSNQQKILSLKYISEEKSKGVLTSLDFKTEEPIFETTVIESEKKLKEIFEKLNSDYKRRSECSDRAHVWAWEMFKENGIKSEKVFAFFTASWIIKTGLKWWFHVAPLVSVKTENGIEKRVMDFMFNSKPLSIKEWTDNMVFDRRPCKLTRKFSEYDVNPQTEACYMMIDNMFYRLPDDLHRQELYRIYRSSWNMSEMRSSYNLGFNKFKELEP